ncbi:SRY-related HMG-box transcription factor [Pleurotus pulmonarius]
MLPNNYTAENTYQQPSSGSPWSPQDQYLWTLSPQSVADSPSPSSTSSTTSSLGSPEREARPLKPKGGRSRSPGHIPRPRNSFMIYRSHCLEQKKIDVNVEHDHRIISRIIANLWNSMPAAEKAVWTAKARAEKASHALRYPNYRYNPKSRKGKDAPVKRKVKRNGKKDLYRATKLAELITEGKTGNELAVAAKRLELIAASPAEDVPATEQREESEEPAPPSLLLQADTPYVWHPESPKLPLLSRDEPSLPPFCQPFRPDDHDAFGQSLRPVEVTVPSVIGTDLGVYRFNLPESTQSTVIYSDFCGKTQFEPQLEFNNISASCRSTTNLQPASFMNSASPSSFTPSSSSSSLSPTSPLPSLPSGFPPAGYPHNPLYPVEISPIQPLQLSSFRGHCGDPSWSFEIWAQVYPSLFLGNENWTFAQWMQMYPDLFMGLVY